MFLPSQRRQDHEPRRCTAARKVARVHRHCVCSSRLRQQVCPVPAVVASSVTAAATLFMPVSVSVTPWSPPCPMSSMPFPFVSSHPKSPTSAPCCNQSRLSDRSNHPPKPPGSSRSDWRCYPWWYRHPARSVKPCIPLALRQSQSCSHPPSPCTSLAPP